MQAGRLDADAAYGVGTVTNGSRWSSAVDRQTGATGADMGDAHPSTGSPTACTLGPSDCGLRF